jgi:hypothetical protein
MSGEPKAIHKYNKKFNAESFRAVLPKKFKHIVTNDLVDRILSWEKEPVKTEIFLENVMTYNKVLLSGKFSIEEYLNAVKFVSRLLLEESNIDAYAATFPDRYKRLVEEKGLTKDQIGPYVSQYKSSKLVTSILEMTIIPSHVLNAPLHQKALNELSKIMVNSRSDIARVNAAAKILEYTKPPEAAKLEIDLSVRRDESIDELREVTQKLVDAQLKSIKAGHSVKEIAEMTIVDASYEEVS